MSKRNVGPQKLRSPKIGSQNFGQNWVSNSWHIAAKIWVPNVTWTYESNWRGTHFCCFEHHKIWKLILFHMGCPKNAKKITFFETILILFWKFENRQYIWSKKVIFRHFWDNPAKWHRSGAQWPSWEEWSNFCILTYF